MARVLDSSAIHSQPIVLDRVASSVRQLAGRAEAGRREGKGREADRRVVLIHLEDFREIWVRVSLHSVDSLSRGRVGELTKTHCIVEELVC